LAAFLFARAAKRLDHPSEQRSLAGMAQGKQNAEDQHKAFVRADESEDAFDKALRKVASAPPPKSVQKSKKTARRTAQKRRSGERPSR
jgi:hypothetical protein